MPRGPARLTAMPPTLPSHDGPVKGAHGLAPDGASRHRAACGSAKAADPRALSSLGRGGRQPSCRAPGPMAGRNVRCWSVCRLPLVRLPLDGALSLAALRSGGRALSARVEKFVCAAPSASVRALGAIRGGAGSASAATSACGSDVRSTPTPGSAALGPWARPRGLRSCWLPCSLTPCRDLVGCKSRRGEMSRSPLSPGSQRRPATEAVKSWGDTVPRKAGWERRWRHSAGASPEGRANIWAAA